MAAPAQFHVTDRRAPREEVHEDIRRMAERLAEAAAERTPRLTGRMASSWEVHEGDDPGTSFVSNSAPYARYVEYGTRTMPAEAPLGRAMTSTRPR